MAVLFLVALGVLLAVYGWLMFSKPRTVKVKSKLPGFVLDPMAEYAELSEADQEFMRRNLELAGVPLETVPNPFDECRNVDELFEVMNFLEREYLLSWTMKVLKQPSLEEMKSVCTAAWQRDLIRLGQGKKPKTFNNPKKKLEHIKPETPKEAPPVQKSKAIQSPKAQKHYIEHADDGQPHYTVIADDVVVLRYALDESTFELVTTLMPEIEYMQTPSKAHPVTLQQLNLKVKDI